MERESSDSPFRTKTRNAGMSGSMKAKTMAYLLYYPMAVSAVVISAIGSSGLV